MLNEELKLQEEFFKKELKENLEHASNLASNSLLNDQKFVSLMTKLNDEQRKYFKEKTHFENNVKITAEMARQKVRELESELEKQAKFFEQQCTRYEQEIQMLKELNLGVEKDFRSKDEQISMLIEQVNKFKREKKDAVSIVKQREIELSRANKRIVDLQK